MTVSDETGRTARIYGMILVAAATLSVAFAMIHPSLHAHNLAEALQQLVAGAWFNGWVHGILIALAMILVAGFTGLSRQLGFDRPLVAAAMTAYAFGTVAMMGAAVVNGFATSMLAGRYVDATPDQLAGVGPAINAMGSMAATWAGIGAVASSAAILCWSLRLLAFPGAARVIGGLGILLGLATAAMLVAGILILNVHGFLLLVLSQAIWTIAVGTLLIRGRL